MDALGWHFRSVVMTEVAGIWSEAVEDALQEAMLLYPPSGRRKQLSRDENKMFGSFSGHQES